MEMKSVLHSRSQSAMPDATGRVLAIDFGRKRFGLAISDKLGVTARPLSTFARTNRRDDLRRLRLLAREHGVRCIVVGLPLHLDGAESEMAAEATRFATRLAQHLSLPVEMADERLTSWEAAQHAPTESRAHGEPRKLGKRATHDDIAAAIILREYLAARPPARKRATAARTKT
jgi:putative Holliday junction resolvase